MVHVVVTTAFAGVERYLTYVTPALVGRGLRITVVGGEPAAMAAGLEGTGVDFVPAPTAIAAGRAVVRLRPDVVHAHMSLAEAASVATKHFHGAPLVATRHFAARRGSSTLGRLVAPVLARNIDREIAISSYVASAIEDSTTPIVIPHAVPNAEAGPHDASIVLVAQRLESEKDSRTALEAWALSCLADRGWRLSVAGDGAGRSALEQRARDLDLEGSVEWLGFRDDVGDLMASAAVFLATASSEAFGLAVAEAMARATPVVAAAGGGHLETVGAVSRQWLFPAGDSEACASRLVALAEDAEARRVYGAALRSRQQSELSLAGHAFALTQLYESL